MHNGCHVQGIDALIPTRPAHSGLLSWVGPLCCTNSTNKVLDLLAINHSCMYETQQRRLLCLQFA